MQKKTKKYKNQMWQRSSFLVRAMIIFLIFVAGILIIFLNLPLIFRGYLTLTVVESSSMSHQIDFNEYWTAYGNWYEENNISKQQFSEFPLKNGFNKGDVIIVWKTSELKIGDIITFKKAFDSKKPIIHRIVSIDKQGIIQTKGDNTRNQSKSETNITQNQIIGKAILKIPLLGWPKIWLDNL